MVVPGITAGALVAASVGAPCEVVPVDRAVVPYAVVAVVTCVALAVVTCDVLVAVAGDADDPTTGKAMRIRATTARWSEMAR